MAELSQETRAIIERLKAEGDLLRNSGTNSIKQVNIKLDKFQGLFDTISTNLAEQTSLISARNKLESEILERDRTREQLNEIDPPEKSTAPEKDDDSDNKKKTDATIEKIGDSIGSALSLKKIALAGASAFVGYNLLKGFIDEKTGGGFTEFENNFGKFASQLGEINIKQTMDDLKASVDELKTTINDFKTRVDEIIDSLGDPLKWAAAIAGLFGGFTAWRATMNAWRRYSELQLEKEKNRGRTSPRGRGTTIEGPGERARYLEEQRVKNSKGKPGGKEAGGRGTKIEGQNERARYLEQERVKNSKAKPGNPPPKSPPPKSNFQNRSIRPAIDGRRENGQFATKDQIEQAFKDQRMRKIFTKLVRGLGVIGILLEVYEMYKLYEILNSDADDETKIKALGSTIGGFIGAVGGLTAGASVGAFFGPFGALIVGAIGAGLGAWAGSYIGELIVKWAFDESVSSEDRAKNAAMVNATTPSSFQGYENMSQQDYVNTYGVGGTAYGTNNTPDYMKYADPNYNASQSSSGTPMQYGGRGGTVEGQGDRVAYTRQREAAMLDALIQVQQTQNNNMQDIMSYLGIEPKTAGSGKTAQLNAVAAGAGSGGGTVVVNNTSAPVTVNNQDAGDNVTMLSVSGGGGGGSGINPIGATDAFNMRFP